MPKKVITLGSMLGNKWFIAALLLIALDIFSKFVRPGFYILLVRWAALAGSIFCLILAFVTEARKQ